MSGKWPIKSSHAYIHPQQQLCGHHPCTKGPCVCFRTQVGDCESPVQSEADESCFATDSLNVVLATDPGYSPVWPLYHHLHHIPKDLEGVMPTCASGSREAQSQLRNLKWSVY